MLDIDAFLAEESEKGKKVEGFLSILTEYEANNQLEIELALALCTDRISYADWLLLVKFLGCHTYVLPAERELLPALSDFLYQKKKYNLFSLALLASHIAAHFSLEQQAILLRRLSSLQVG